MLNRNAISKYIFERWNLKFSHLEGTPHLFHGLLSQLFTCQSHGQDPEAKLCTQSVVVKLKIDDFGLLGNNSSKASVSPPNCGLSFGLDPRPGTHRRLLPPGGRRLAAEVTIFSTGFTRYQSIRPTKTKSSTTILPTSRHNWIKDF
jgi:hypothetical protein